MTLNRKATVREIGRRTGLKQRDVQLMLETLIEVWTEELVRGGRVEIENFLVLAIKETWTNPRSTLPRRSKRIIVRTSKQLKSALVK